MKRKTMLFLILWASPGHLRMFFDHVVKQKQKKSCSGKFNIVAT